MRLPVPKQKVTSLSSQQEGQEMPCQSPKGRSHLEMLRHETRPCQSRASIRERMIKNVDGIFQSMEGLMKNLHQLREIEADHCRLLTMYNPKPTIKVAPGKYPLSLTPGEEIVNDYTDMVDSAQGYTYVLMRVDNYTGWPEAWPTKREDSASVVKFLVNQYIPHHGFPRKVRSDNGTHFTTCNLQELEKMLGLKHSFAAVYHPQSQGMSLPCSRTQRSMSMTEMSVDTPLALLADAPPLEEDTVHCQNWQETVEPHTLASLGSREIERQAVIYELFTTEASHLRTLRVLDQVFFQKMRNLLTVEELSCIFPNLPQVYSLHANLCESMKRLRDSPIVQGIGDIMVSRFEDAAGEEFQEQVSHLCSQQSQALELIKNKRKDPPFAHLIQECEASPHCRRLQLKDLLVSEMQRLTKYPLLLDNIIRHTEGMYRNTHIQSGSPDLQPLLRAQACCRGILRAVNEVVRETEHRRLLSRYQRRLDLSPLERQASPVAAQFKNLDLTTKKLIHEGPLTWKVSKDKAIDIHALLLSDMLVLLQRGSGDRLILRCPAHSLGGVWGRNTDLKTPFCPVVRLDSSLVRSVATALRQQRISKILEAPHITYTHERINMADMMGGEEPHQCEQEVKKQEKVRPDLEGEPIPGAGNMFTDGCGFRGPYGGIKAGCAVVAETQGEVDEFWTVKAERLKGAAHVELRQGSVDTPLALLADAPPLEEDTVHCQNWQETVEPHTLASLGSREIERQAVIY
ncbi:hypothetical protein P4O66_022149, partial [Electrophorus voltai]